MCKLDALRVRLESVSTWPRPIDQKQELSRILVDLQHSVIPVEDSEVLWCNCFALALGLAQISDYEELHLADQQLQKGIFANSKFMRYLLDCGYLQCAIEPKPGDVILYFAGDRVTHAGKVVDRDRVISKWGTGIVLNHCIWEVPLSYGTKCEYFREIPADRVFELFLGFVRPADGFAEVAESCDLV